MTIATPTKARLEDIEAVKDFPRRAAAAMAELDDMLAVAERLTEAEYPGGEQVVAALSYCQALPETARYLRDIKKSVEELLADKGEVGAFEYDHWVVGKGVSVEQAIGLVVDGGGSDVQARVAALLAHAANRQ